MDAQLLLAPAAPPAGAGATDGAASSVVRAAADPSGLFVAAATAGGTLHLLPLQAGEGVSAADAYALTLRPASGPAEALLQPWAALALLPGGAAAGGLLCAQRGSTRLLFCQHPAAALELGQPGAEAFLLGGHPEPITAVAASLCGALALSGDAGGSLRLWGLADGAQLAAAAASAAAPIACAQFLPGGGAATAHEGRSMVCVWTASGEGGLELAAELEAAGAGGGGAGGRRAVTSLAAAGGLLAAGCSDGATLLWQRGGGAGQFGQQALLPAAAPAAITALAFSADASLLAAAAGRTVSICCTASAERLACAQLASAPAALLWTRQGVLLALLQDGALQKLGQPEQRGSALPEAAETAAAGAPEPAHPALAAAAALLGSAAPAGSRARKSVRFAEAGDEPELVPPPSAAAAVSAVGGLEALAALLHVAPPKQPGGPRALPQLPSHPLLRSGADPGASSSASALEHGSGLQPASGRPADFGPPAAQVTSPRRQPLYPILDLRALRGLQAEAPPQQQPVAAAAAAPRLPSPAKRPAVAFAGAVATCRSVRHAATCTEPAVTEQAAVLPATDPGSCASSPPVPAEGGGAAEEEEEQPRALHPPAPTQRRPASPGRVSKQTCDACVTLATAAAGGSRPSSPAKAAQLARLAALRAEAEQGAAGVGGPGCARRPCSPVKLGVACTLAEQQRGEEQPPEVLALTVEERDASLPLPAARRQRYGLVARRRQPTAGQHPAQHEQQDGCLEKHEHKAAAVEQRHATLTVRFTAPPHAEEAPGAAATADAASVPPPLLPAIQPPGDYAVHGDDELLSEGEEEEGVQAAACSSAGPMVPPSTVRDAATAWSSPLAPQCAAAQAELQGSGASEASTETLSDAPAVRPRALHPRPQHAPAGAPPGGAPCSLATNCDAAAAAAPTSHSSMPALGQVAGMLRELDGRLASLAGRVARQERSQPASPAAAAPAPPAARLPLTTEQLCSAWHQEAVRSLQVPTAEPPAADPAEVLQPASALAAPARNGSLLLVRRAEQLEAQAAAAASAPLPQEQVMEARQRAATAATTLPPGAALFGSLLPPPPAPPRSPRLSPAKAAALAGARKQLGERWLAEQAEVRPALEAVWAAEDAERARCAQQPGLAPLPPLAVPLPDPRSLVADLLGLRL